MAMRGIEANGCEWTPRVDSEHTDVVEGHPLSQLLFRLRRFMVLAGGAGLVASCTIFEPIQTPEDDRRFPLKSEARTVAPCVPRSDDASDCKTLMVDIDVFRGGLGRAILEMDLRRRQLIAQAAEHTNTNSTFNALLWPIGAYLVARKINNPAWSAVDATAVAVGTYGLLNSGISDRDRLYLRAATRMLCSMVDAQADLYPENLVQPPWERGLDTLIADLNRKAEDQLQQRDDMLLRLKLKQLAAPKVGATQVEQRRFEALGRGGGANPLSDPTDDLIRQTDALQAKAQQTLVGGRELLQRIDDSGARLRARRSKIEEALAQALNERTPELRNPLDVSRDIAKAFEQGMSTERAITSRATLQSGKAPEVPWLPTPARLSGLETDSAKEVRNFWLTYQTPLRSSESAVADWRSDHEARVRSVSEEATAMGCRDGDLAQFTADLLKRVGNAAGNAPSNAPNATVSPLAGGQK